MSALRQTFAITAIGLRTIPERLGPASVVCIGIAGVVAVLITVLAMGGGLRTAQAQSARADRAIVLAAGARAEATSFLSRDDVAVIAGAPGIRRAENGAPAVSAELLLPVNVTRKSNGQSGTVSVRGVTPLAVAVRTDVRLIAGRMLATGVREIVVGRAANEQFANLDVGGSAHFYNGDWTVVGVFASGGDAHESELLADADTLMSAARRSGYNAVTVGLDTPTAFDGLRDALANDRRVKVDVERETDYFGQRSAQAGAVMDVVATTIAGIMAIGALLGALNTMYSAVSARGVEIATLRAVGFGATPVVVSVLAEAELLALLGGCFGAAIAWLLFNDHSFTTGTLTGQTTGYLHIDARLIVEGIVWAALIGLVGGMFPAMHAARASVADALRVS